MSVIIESGWYVSQEGIPTPQFGFVLTNYADLLEAGLKANGFQINRIEAAKEDRQRLERASFVVHYHAVAAISSHLVMNYGAASHIGSTTQWCIERDARSIPTSTDTAIRIVEDESCRGIVDHVASLFQDVRKLTRTAASSNGKPARLNRADTLQTFEDLRAGFENAIQHHLALPLFPQERTTRTTHQERVPA